MKIDEFVKNMEDGVNWYEVQKFFDKLEDINEIFYFLRMLIDKLSICSSSECSIFPDLHDIDVKRLAFQKDKLYTLEQINSIENMNFKRQMIQRYNIYIVEAKRILGKIFALKTSVETKKFNDKENLEDFIRILETINQNNHPIPIEIGGTLNKFLLEKTASVDLSNPELSQKARKLQKELKEVKYKNAKVNNGK